MYSSNNIQTLRLNGYIVNESGFIECDREGERYEQSRVAIIEIYGSREVVDLMIAVADSPRALVGRHSDGAAVLVFRRDGEKRFEPYVSGSTGKVFDLVMNTNGQPLRLVFGVDGLSASTWTWGKGRSPADVSRDSLPNLTADVCDDVAREALGLATDARAVREEAERNKGFEQRRAKYLADLARPKTADELQAEEDREILDRYANEVLAWNDPDKARLDAARARFARRLKQTAAV
jgi:hypothetical protein